MSGSFQRGWEFFSKNTQADVSAKVGSNYCKEVENAINTFSNKMQETVEKHGDLAVDKCKGFVAETWHAYTFNIDAVLKGSKHTAKPDESTKLGSVDVSTNFGKAFSMKYIENAEKSANAQAKNYYDKYYEYLANSRKSPPLTFEEYLEKHGIENTPEQLFQSVYSGQYRVIPCEQLDEAREFLKDKMKDLNPNDPHYDLKLNNLKEVLDKITDKVTDDNGVESYKLDKESAEAIVELIREGKFKPEDFGIDISKLVTTDYILEQALQSGYTAAVMSLVMEVAPKICEAILYLIRNGEINPEQIKEIGVAAIKGSALGFIRGFISCALTIACQSGKLGKQLMKVPGNVIAAVVVMAMETIQNAILVVAGKMTVREMFMKTEDAAIVTIGGLIGGVVGVAVLPQFAVIGGLIGSFVGSVVGSLVAEGKNALIMALCLNTGITLFGLVDQNYTLSKEMIDKLGIKVVTLMTTQLNRNELKHNQLNRNELKRNELHTLDFYTLRRGVIGVRQIGYV